MFEQTEVKPPLIIGFLCEWAAQLDEYLNDDGTLAPLPNVHIIKIPCSGYVKPAWVEKSIQEGADGVWVCGCPMVDCHYREGNIFIRDRMTGERNPYLRLKGGRGGARGVDPHRVRGFWKAGVSGPELIQELKEFSEALVGHPIVLGPVKPVRRHDGPVLDSSPWNPTGPEPELSPP
ncbi:MAG: hydrogenase iron-sulfur subunit [Armatimonadetes bacterium]|nr:hydrogenase iron-sulfur subunit [Armatimonadota bacterium]